MTGSWSTLRTSDRIGIAFFVLAMVLIGSIAARKPAYNWDMIPYIALADDRPGIDATARHADAYRRVQAVVPAQDWVLLTRSSPYRTAQHANPAAFETQLGMYRVKIGYIDAARMIAARVPPDRAYRTLNLIALVLCSAAVTWWMIAARSGRTAFVLVPIMVLAKIVPAAQIVSPDLLCTALAVAGLALLRRDRWVVASLVFAAATLTRPDFALLPGAMLVVAWSTRKDVVAATSIAAAAAAAYAVTMLVGDYPGWWPHFSESLIERVADLRTIPPFSAGAYLHALARAMVANFETQTWPALIMAMASGWLSLSHWPRSGYRWHRADALFVALLLSLGARCVLFPMPDDRLYLPTVLMLALLLVERWAWHSADRRDAER